MTIHKYERGPRITHNTPFAFVSHPPATARHPKKHPTPSSLPRASFAPHPSSRGPCFLIPRRGQGWRGGRTPSAWTRAWRRGPPPTGRRQLLLWTSGAVKESAQPVTGKRGRRRRDMGRGPVGPVQRFSTTTSATYTCGDARSGAGRRPARSRVITQLYFISPKTLDKRALLSKSRGFRNSYPLP